MIRADFYAMLGVAPTASAEEIRQAFRQLARQYHPDANPDDMGAVEHFKIINEAYRVLSTPQLRSAYDHALRIIHVSSSSHSNRPALQRDLAAHQGQNAISTPDAAASPLTMPHIGSMNTKKTQTPLPCESALLIPALMIRVTPGQLSILPPREATRFYLMTELGTTRESAIIDPMPLDLAQVIDRSSSMRGEKIFETKRAVLRMLDQLHTDDLLTLVFFDDRAEVLADGETVAGRAGIENAIDMLAVRGSTEIATGLSAVLERLAARQNRSRVASLILLTDGQTYGDEGRCLELAAHAREIGISITALGLGLDWNRELLDRLAAISGGSSHFVERPADLQRIFEDVVLRLRATLAAGMRLTLDPAAGVHIARATRIAPDIAEAHTGPTGPLGALAAMARAPVTVDLGALVGRPDIESAAVVWEVALDPAGLTQRQGSFDLGRLVATYWAPRQGGGRWSDWSTISSCQSTKGRSRRHSSLMCGWRWN